MKSKLTFLAALVAALLMVSSAAFASGTRMASMGLTGADSMIQKDSMQWSTNPATIAFYPSLITAYWDAASGTAALANTHGGGKLLTKPISGVDFYMLASADYTSSALRGSDLNKTVGTAGDTRIASKDSFWHFGDEVNFIGAKSASFLLNNASVPGVAGAALNISSSKADNTLAVMMVTTTYAYKINNMAFGLEGSFGYIGQFADEALEWKAKLGAAIGITSTMSVDAAFCYGMPMMDMNGTNYSYTSVMAYDLYAFARFNWQVAETQNLHIFVKYTDGDHSTNYKSDSGTDIDFRRNMRTLQIGISDEMNFSKTSLVYVGIDVNMDSKLNYYDGVGNGGAALSKYSVDTTYWKMNFRFGCDAQLIGGLSGRIGVVHDMLLYDVNNRKDNYSVGKPSRNTEDSPYNYRTEASIGLAYKIGGFILEGTLNKALFTTGLTQGETMKDICGSITFIYTFGDVAAAAAAPAPAAANEEK